MFSRPLHTILLCPCHVSIPHGLCIQIVIRLRAVVPLALWGDNNYTSAGTTHNVLTPTIIYSFHSFIGI